MSDLINTAMAPTGIAAIFSALFDGLISLFHSIIDFFINSLEVLLREIIQAVTHNPLRTAILILSIALTGNPLGIAGFSGIGVTAGSSAAAWQAVMGNVPAGSVFSVLQSFAMRHGVVLPVAGGVLATAEVVRMIAGQMGDGKVHIMKRRKELMEQVMNGEVRLAEYERRKEEMRGIGTWNCVRDSGRYWCEPA